jgi:hypothetical protein
LQFAIAELTEGSEICLALVTRDSGGDPAVDEAAEARQEEAYSSPDIYPRDFVALGGIKHSHGNFPSKGCRCEHSDCIEGKPLAATTTMHVAAEKDFQRVAIYAPDAHEMRLIRAVGLMHGDPREARSKPLKPLRRECRVIPV